MTEHLRGGEKGRTKGGTLLVVDDVLAVNDVLVVNDASGGCSALEPLRIVVGAECWPEQVASWHRRGRSDGESRGRRTEA